jgi:hypothetical protein
MMSFPERYLLEKDQKDLLREFLRFLSKTFQTGRADVVDGILIHQLLGHCRNAYRCRHYLV